MKLKRGRMASRLFKKDFAKLLGYPINKYAETEKTDRYGRGEIESPVEDELLEKLVMIAHANPYWLFDSHCDADFAHADPSNESIFARRLED